MRKSFSILLLLGLVCASCRLQRDDPGRGITLEVAVFEGGYGIEWHKQMARQYERLHPGIHIDLWGDPRVDEKLKPRILRRNPPDLASCGLPVWKLIVAGKLYPLDAALDYPAYGQPNITWRQSLVKGVLSDYQYQGHTYAVPTNLGCWVCWYDRRMFRKHGWQVPRTWGEFTHLCDQIKAAGIAPLAFQGKYPYYAWATLLSLYERLVPFERWYRMEDFLPGAYTDPEFIHAARLVQEMATRYFEPGALAMTHTESQLEWVHGSAAMVFCGLWLENEMKNAIPPGFEMACFPVPVVEGGHGDPHAIYGGGGEMFFAFSDAPHPKEAVDFLKYLLSMDPARAYTRQLDTLSPVRNSERGISLSPDLQSAVDVMHASSRLFSDRIDTLFPEFTRGAEQVGLADLLAGKITPEQFGKELEAGMEDIRRDPDIYKPPPQGVPQ
ncbi:MAG TPA: extracellular solute-binding protein [Chthonomonadaceae bacterium]|nr:extracellular solute-binding protein [Chthonomonadaceae bacterium]